ncbi:MAG TPA: alpha/beta hydrolase, partial [Stellaceae bacterium]|nr:alpha/beta hydrolase [Stellaceae bacterium]
AALLVAWRARRAERDRPPPGRFLEIAGVRLHYLERGAGPPLLLLHGNGAMVQDFAISGILEPLVRRYRVIAVDRPGFGYTNRPRSQVWTPAAQAELVHEALHRLGIDQAVVVGHSWGTLVALALALDYPADVKSLVLLSGYYFPVRRTDVLAFWPLAVPGVGDLLSHTVAPLLGRAMLPWAFRKIFAPAAVPSRFAAEFPSGLALRPSQLQASAGDTVAMRPGAAALAGRYGEIGMPVAIVAGTGDQIVDFARQSARLVQALPHAALIPVEGGGHMIHHIAPLQVVEAIDRAAGGPASSE